MSIFGDNIDSADVEEALLTFLREWMPTYITEIVRQKDPAGTIWPNGVAAVRSFTVVHAAEEKWPEDQLPMLLAHSPGLAEEPEAQGDGTVSAKYACGLSAIASGSTLAMTKALARVYGSAARMAILQHEGLGGFAEGVEWKDERLFPVVQGVEAERNLMSVSGMYVIEVAQVLNRDGGPREPLEPPYTEPDPWVVVKEGGGSATVAMIREPPGEPEEPPEP